MKTLKIMEILTFNNYYLIDKENNEYYLVLEFHNMNEPNILDYIQIDENLLDPKYSGYAQPYALEPTEKDDFCAILISGNKTIHLRRLYG